MLKEMTPAEQEIYDELSGIFENEFYICETYRSDKHHEICASVSHLMSNFEIVVTNTNVRTRQCKHTTFNRYKSVVSSEDVLVRLKALKEDVTFTWDKMVGVVGVNDRLGDFYIVCDHKDGNILVKFEKVAYMVIVDTTKTACKLYTHDDKLVSIEEYVRMYYKFNLPF